LKANVAVGRCRGSNLQPYRCGMPGLAGRGVAGSGGATDIPWNDRLGDTSVSVVRRGMTTILRIPCRGAVGGCSHSRRPQRPSSALGTVAPVLPNGPRPRRAVITAAPRRRLDRVFSQVKRLPHHRLSERAVEWLEHQDVRRRRPCSLASRCRDGRLHSTHRDVGGTQSADTPDIPARQDARSSRSRRRDRRFRAIGRSPRGALPKGPGSVVVVSGPDIDNLRRAGAEPQPVRVQMLAGSARRGLQLSRGARDLIPPGLRL
jgi:hypothetical protein